MSAQVAASRCVDVGITRGRAVPSGNHPHDRSIPEYSVTVVKLYGGRVTVAASAVNFQSKTQEVLEMNRTIHAVKKSNYLTRADVDPAIVVTIKEVIEEEMDTPKGPEMKFVCYFDEREKGTVLNWINSQTIAKILGSESFDDWPGGKIVLYDDPNVMFGQQLVGGIRVRAPRKRPVAKPEPEPEFDDEIPFGDEEEAA